MMIFTDRLFMAQLGPEQMNATMLGGFSVFVMSTFFWGLTGYCNALVAQYYGANQKWLCGTVISQAIIISLIGYPIILLLRPLVIAFFNVSGIEPIQLEAQKTFFNILSLGTIFSLLRVSLGGFFTGIGKSSIIMVSAFVALIVNFCANYVLIFGHCGLPALGIKGAALGSILGGFCGFLVLLIAYGTFRLKKEFGIQCSLVYNHQIMKKLFSFGYPAGIEMFSNLIAINLLIMIFHTHGIITATAATIVFNWDLVSYVPLTGLQIGVMSLVGRAMGGQKPDEAHSVTLSALFFGWMYSGIFLLLFALIPTYLVDVFKPQTMSTVFEQARPLAIFMVRIASIYVMVDTLFTVLTGALRGAGDTLWAMIITCVLHWLLVPTLYILLQVFDLSAHVGWVINVLVFVLFGLIITWRYNSGKWRTIKMVDE